MIERLKSRHRGLKFTPQRLAILDFLDENSSHPSAEDIFSAIKEKHPTISLATVYNTLDSLKKRGDLLELTIDPSRKHYDPDTRPHHHIICSRCGKIGDIFDEKLKIEIEGKDFDGFIVSSYHINFEGVCLMCSP